MRKLVREKTPDVFLAEEADINKFYGVVTDLSKDKCFITKPYYKNGRYQLRNTHLFTEGNDLIVASIDLPPMKLTKYLKFIQNLHTTREIWEFETAQELFKWLSE